MHGFGQRFVFKQLEELVFKDHSAFSRGHVLTDFKLAFVRHGHMALLHVVQQIFYPQANALAAGVDGFFNGIGVQRHEIAGRGGGQ